MKRKTFKQTSLFLYLSIETDNRCYSARAIRLNVPTDKIIGKVKSMASRLRTELRLTTIGFNSFAYGLLG